MKKPLIRLAITGLALLALSACELRHDGGVEPEPKASETSAVPETTPTPEPATSETPVASIIRDDVREEEVVKIPVEPLRVSVPFATGGNDIDAAAQRVLLGVLQSEALREGWPVILRGHTDSSGNDSANLRASRSRAETVAAWLVERGVDDDRIRVIAFGEQNPLAPNANPDGSPDEEGRARNRRVDIEIAAPAPPAASETADTNEDA